MESPKSRITLREIAQQLGISSRAVSQALRTDGTGTTRVATETVERVRAVAKAGGYRANTGARTLRTSRFRQIGFFVRYNFEERLPPVIEMPAIVGMGDYLNTKDWHLVVLRDKGSDLHEGTPRYLREQCLDGFVISSIGSEADELRASEMRHWGVPYVWFNNNNPTNAAGIRDVLGAELATRHLVELGHRRIVFVASAGTHCSVAERQLGYSNVMKSHGLEPVIYKFENPRGNSGRYERLDSKKERDSSREGYIRSVIEDLVPHYWPTGIVCASDIEANVVSRALHIAGIPIPGEISVIGYNDLPFTDVAYPSLSTVRVDFYALGRVAAEMILELADSPEAELKSQFITPELVVRESTGPAPARLRSNRRSVGEVQLRE